MAKAPLDARCDIWMSFDEWRRIKDKPVFFLSPAKLQNILGAGVTVERVYRGAGPIVKAPLGRDAVRRALDFQPSFLSKIVDIKNVINQVIPGSLEDADVIAAAFAMPRLNVDMKAADLTNSNLAAAIRYRPEAVQAARSHYRVPLDFAMKTMEYLRKAGVPIENVDEYATILGGGDRRFVMNVGSKEKPDYVFGQDDLVPAPATGHQWARDC
jgi:hypothetical protein